MFKDNLIEIQNDLNNMKKISKNNLMQKCINNKINRITEKYNEVVDLNINYILSRSNYKAIKAIDRYMKKKEKQNGNESNYGFIEII